MKRKYAKDYEEYQEQAGLPGRKRKYRYIGPYFCYEYQTGRTQMLIRYGLLTAALTVIWIAAGWINSPGSRFGPVGIPYVIAFIALFYLLCGVTAACGIREDRLERSQYDASCRRIGRSLLGFLVLLGMILIGDIIFMFVYRSGMDWKSELSFFACMTAACFLLCAIRHVYRRNPCNEVNTEQNDSHFGAEK